MRLRVTVFYREPTFEARLGRRGPPYRWEYEIEAVDAPTAIAIACREFDEVARASGVGWAREIVAWDVTAAA